MAVEECGRTSTWRGWAGSGRLSLLIVLLLLSGCLRDVTELERERIADAGRMGILPVDEKVTVYTHNDSLAFVWGDDLISDNSGIRLIGNRSFVSKPDTILLRDIVAVSYDAAVVVLTTSGVRHDWRAGGWRLLYEDGHLAALACPGDGTRLPLDSISHMSIDGGLNRLCVVGWVLFGVTAYHALIFIALSQAM